MNVLINAFLSIAARLNQGGLPTMEPATMRRSRTPNKATRRTYSLVQSNGDGTALWKCRQTGEFKTLPIADNRGKGPQKRQLSAMGSKWFFGESAA